ncbi:substrate-binding periplasmic protein [Planctobacterium marinum]|uniref:Solute-binding protein family 3/N-terminal domain-containing protein n=1 Tax=Planctobacterium marinum TaxID=1631968 RepID=A0AA48KUD1_9ALTE|nr:hypothetical protein MACH26_39850 [Planctobacterium marinum]
MTDVSKTILTLFAVTSALFAKSTPAEDYLIYGIPNYPPYSVYEEQGFSGRDVELINTLAEQMNIPIRFSPCDWIRCLQLAKSGRIDVLTSVNRVKEREAFLHFIEPAYSISNIVFVVRKNEVTHYDSLLKFKETVIGREKGARLLDQVDHDSDIEKYESPDIVVLFKMLASERLDAVMGGDVAMKAALHNSGYGEQLALALYRVQVPSAYLAVARHSKRAEKHLNNLRAEMTRLHMTGQLARFSHWQELKN